MSVNYHDILAEVAVRINALTGAQAAALETAYLVRPLTGSQFQSAVFPFSAVKESLLLAEEQLARWIAETGNHPWRAFLRGQTANMAHRATLPSAVGSDPIIGIWGVVSDASDDLPCTEQPVEVIERRVANSGTFFTVARYHFKIWGDRIYHTRPNVKIDVCKHNRATQKAAIDANAAILLPDALEEAYICGALSYLVRDGQFIDQALGYRKYFQDTGDGIKQGFVSVPPVSAPAGSVKTAEG